MEPRSGARQVITFYSYKGGTGRSMALANCACLLARGAVPDASGKGRPQRVLAIDWDLEAPGLHRYFAGVASITDDGPGLLDLFEHLDQETASWEVTDREASRTRAQQLLADSRLGEYLTPTKIPGLSLLKAGRFDDRYAGRVNTFPWADLYRRVPGLFSALVERLTEEYDYVLVDSRTGLSDISGICTTLLPDKLVVVFTPNLQSLTGIDSLVRKAAEYRRGSDNWRPLSVFPLPSRVEAARPSLLETWRFGGAVEFPEGHRLEGYQPQFERLLRDVFDLGADCSLSEYFDEVQLQHIPDYAYGEPLPVETERETRLSLRRSYESFTERLITLAGPWERVDAVRAQQALDVTVAQAVEMLAAERYKRAEALLEHALESHRSNPTVLSLDLADALSGASRARTRQSEDAEALRLADLALEVATRALAADDPRRGRYLDELALALAANGRHAEALERADESLHLKARVLGEKHAGLVETLQVRAQLFSAVGRLSEATQDLERAVALREKAYGDSDPELIPALLRLSELRSAIGDLFGARDLLGRALDLVQNSEPDSDRSVAILHLLGRSALLTGEFETAETHLTHALQLLETTQAGGATSRADILDDLGELALRESRLERAEERYALAHQLREQELGPAHQDTILSMVRLADVADRAGRGEEALRQYERALVFAERLLGAEHNLVPDILLRRGSLLFRFGRVQEAEESTHASLAISERQGNALACVRAYRQLASIAWSTERRQAAKEWVRESLRINQEQLLNLTAVATDMLNLGRLEQGEKAFPAAEEWYRQALELGEQVGHPGVLEAALSGLAVVVLERGEAEESLRLVLHALTIDTRSPTRQRWEALHALSIILRKLGREQFVALWERVAGSEISGEFLEEIWRIADADDGGPAAV
jgi:eukaryotic-like serine/threonine-protein kinase